DHVISPGVARLISRTCREEAAKIHQRTIHETGPVAPVDAGRHSVADNFALAEQLSDGFRMHFPREAVEGFVDGIRIVMQSGYRPVHRMVPTQRFHSPRHRPTIAGGRLVLKTDVVPQEPKIDAALRLDRKSTRLNSSHVKISY